MASVARASFMDRFQERSLDAGTFPFNSTVFSQLAHYDVQFQSCLSVQAYDDDLAQRTPDTVRRVNRFVNFRLCPDDSCDRGFGDYLVDLGEFLESTVQHQLQRQEFFCQACETECAADAAFVTSTIVDCETCSQECMNIENLEEFGFIDAAEFLECSLIYDSEDDAVGGLYAGPLCTSGGGVEIGVFRDEDCFDLDPSKNVDDFLVDADGVNLRLSYALLDSVYMEKLSCKSDDDTGVHEMCQSLFEQSGKCERPNGLNLAGSVEAYPNQYLQAEAVCVFIDALTNGEYSEGGVIRLDKDKKESKSGKQKDDKKKDDKKQKSHKKSKGSKHAKRTIRGRK